MKRSIFLLLLLTSVTSGIFAQGRVSGTVVDENEEPLIGATVLLKNSTTGTVTDMNGKYSLSVPGNESTLVFSYVGYQTEEVVVGSRQTIRIQMKPDLTQLSELVAVGYGSQKRANLTGAVSTVSVSDVEGRAITSTSQLLQGKIAGVNIVQNSGRPGDDGSTIRIRGVSSIDNNNDPLVIIDGVEGGFEDIHPSDIESISVLKDAASASIYGSRASAGVIVIETKKGKAGKVKLDYTGSISTQSPTRLPEVVNSWEFAVLRNEARANVGTSPYYTDDQIEKFKYGIDPNYANTNWVDLFFDTAVMHNHHISAKGGGDNYRFSSSTGYSDQGGVLIGTSADKLSFRNQVDVDFIDQKVTVGFTYSGYNRTVNELPSGTNSVISSVVSKPSTTWAESIPDEYGVVRYSGHGRELGEHYLGGGRETKINSLNTRYYIQIKPIKGLVSRLTYVKDDYKHNLTVFRPETISGDIEGNPTTRWESSLQKSWTNSKSNVLVFTNNYTKNIQKHRMSLLGGYERYEYLYNYDSGEVKDLSTNQKIFDFGNPTTHFLNSRANERSTVSYFGRLNYSFADKYLLEFNYRADGSSRFAKHNRWGSFPSLSAGWVVSEERFFQPLTFVDQLKLRASWGRLGNQNIGSYYAASDQMSGSEYYAFGHLIVPGRGTTVLANPETKWETTEQINLGLDLYLFNALKMNIDYFYKTTYDILAKVTIPPSLGVSEIPYQNIGSMRNKGLEVSVGYYSKYKKESWNYSINGNLGFLKNEILDLGVLEYVDHSDVLRSQVGEPYSSLYGYVCDGIYQVSDFVWQDDSNADIPHSDRIYVLKEGLPDPSGIMFNPQPGDLKFKDMVTLDGEESPQITPEDKTIIGRTIPSLTYGVNVNVSYKNVSLNVIGQGVSGIESYQRGPLAQPFYNAGAYSVLREHAERRWTFENQSPKYMRLVEDKARDALISSYYVFDASYFRIKNVELAYSLPTKLLKKVNVERCRVFLSGENLLLITNYLTGFDPEKPSSTTSTGFHPQMTSYTFGVNLNF